MKSLHPASASAQPFAPSPWAPANRAAPNTPTSFPRSQPNRAASPARAPFLRAQPNRAVSPALGPESRALPRVNHHPQTLGPESRALPRVKLKYYRRYRAYDYSRGAALFITIATAPRRALFGRVSDAQVALSPLGRIVAESIAALPRFNPAIALFDWVVMPDHVHFSIHLAAGLDEPLKTLGAAIRKFKTFTTTAARELKGLDTIWQQGYHDYILHSERFIASTGRYIRYNPLKEELRRNQPEFLRIREPVASPRFDPCDYWKAVGELALLDPANKILSLRVSRRVTDHASVVRRLLDAARAGYTILSGFISPGEAAVRDALLATPGARLIHILPNQIAHNHRPDSRFLEPISEGRLLEIGRGNEEIGFARAACLDLNDEIVKIALAGEGLALYWLPEGPKKLKVRDENAHPGNNVRQQTVLI